ncbi:MAG: glycosyl hydrolase family 28-related protein [Cyanobacteriota bacterium]|nr:glycosyl hydrolase family 28-related protein [Cyanobacteriota bacterium]
MTFNETSAFDNLNSQQNLDTLTLGGLQDALSLANTLRSSAGQSLDSGEYDIDLNQFTTNDEDIILGEQRPESIAGGADNYLVVGGQDNDQISGDVGNDLLLGGDGKDTIKSDDGDDILLGGDARDVIRAYSGDDVIDGGLGSDLLYGGPGVDIFVVNSHSERDIIFDFEPGTDVIAVTDDTTIQLQEHQTKQDRTLIQDDSGTTLAVLRGVNINDISEDSIISVSSTVDETPTDSGNPTDDTPDDDGTPVEENPVDETPTDSGSPTDDTPDDDTPVEESSNDTEEVIAPEGAKGKDIRDYGAIPNDGIDDTEAIQRALDDKRRNAQGKPLYNDFNGRPKQLYFPEGTYNVSDTLDWIGSAVTLNGDGSGKTIFQLKDNAQGFGNPDNPKAVFKVPNGNTSFRQNIWNLSVDTGINNSGAIGIDYNSSNNGSMENVTITSGDGQGYMGISMEDGIPGPLLIKNVKIDGFDTGIRNSGPYSATFKDIELTNQNEVGINAGGGTLIIDGLKSNNSVPVIDTSNWFEMVTIVNGDFQGGSPDVSAIEAKGQLYARNIKTQGYQSVIEYEDEVIPGNRVEEYASETSQLFDDSTQTALNLPVQDFPEFHDENLENWGRFKPRWYGDTGPLQDLLDSGKSTIYFPAANYLSFNERVVTVPPTVKKIVGFSSVVNGSPTGKNGGGIKFVVEEDSQDPLIVEGFGYGVKVENQSTRDIAIKDGKYSYTDGPGLNDLFIENITIRELDLNSTENAYAWQLNTESLDKARTKVTNSGANLVVHGIKTEGKGPVIETINGGKTEVLGGVILPIQRFSQQEKQQPAFSIIDSNGLDSQGSISVKFRHYEDRNKMYDILVEERRDGETRKLEQSGSPHQFLALYSGN